MGVQVNLATKERGGQPLPFSKRQFISFSYGGKNIEDFDLIVVFPSDRLDKEIYSPFKDITSTSDVMDGQIYWASFFEAGRLHLTLATDGMTSENYELFKTWFKPGEEKEFILSEFHNRVTYARVAAAPQISLLPFEDKRMIKIGDNSYEFSTSLYKGEIQIEFVMDDPYWQSKQSILSEIANKDDVKMIYEDKLPCLDMFNYNDISKVILLGDKKAITYTGEKYDIKEDYQQSILNANDTNLYLYNCGNAPAKPIIKFTLKPSIDNNGFISLPGNKQYSNNDYSLLKIGSEEFKYTTPSILTSYNQAIKILSEIEEGADILTLRQRMRDELHNYYTRAWVLALIDAVKTKNSETGKISKTDLSNIAAEMPHFITLLKSDNEIIYRDFIFTINSKIGLVHLETSVYAAAEVLYDGSSFLYEGEYLTIVENAGDMVKSKYLNLEEQTVFSIDEDNHLTIGINDCLPIISSCLLTNFSIDFKYTYL